MKFYKYKKVVDDGYVYFRDMLKNEYIYCSDTNKFDDIFDGKMPFGKDDVQKINDEYIKRILEEECCYLDGDRHFDMEKWRKGVNEVIKNADLSDVTADYADDYEPSEEELEENKREEINLNLFTQNKFVSAYKELILDLIKLQKDIRIGSLATDNKNPVLWSMYGDNFKGACIEYEIDESIPKKVIYGHREKYDPVFYSMQKYKNEETISNEECNELLNNLLLSKNEIWSFQNEYRILDKKDKIPCKITSVYFGKSIPDNYKNQIYEEFKEKYNFFNMIFDHYQQTLEFIPVDIRTYLKRRSKHC